MSLKISLEQRQEINLKIDIFELLNRYNVELRQDQSQRFKARCPFHEGDNDPSLTVFAEKNPPSWYCFGCSKGTDPFELFRLLTKKSHEEIVEIFSGEKRELNLEDRIRSILEDGRTVSPKNKIEQVLLTHSRELSIRVRSILRKCDLVKIKSVHCILMEVDEFVERESWRELSEAQIRLRFKEFLTEIKKVAHV